MAKNTQALSGPVNAKVVKKDGILTILIPHGNREFEHPEIMKGPKAGQRAKHGLVARIGSQFGAEYIGDGLYLTLYVGKGMPPTSQPKAGFTVEDED